MKKNMWIALVAMVSLTLAFSSCSEKPKGGGGGKTGGKVTRLDVFPAEDINLYVGGEIVLNAQVQPNDAAVAFAIDNDKVATVTAEGKKATVKAVAVGEAKLTVSAGDKTKGLKVTVKEKGAINEANYIGTDGSESNILAKFYIPDLSKEVMPSEFPMLTEANTAKGWELKEVYKNAKVDILPQYVCPVQNNKYVDSRIYRFIAYYVVGSTPNVKTAKDQFIIAQTGRFKEDLFFTGEKSDDFIKLITEGYGFTKGVKKTELKNGEPAVMAWHPNHPVKDLCMLFYRVPVKDNSGTITAYGYTAEFLVLQSSAQAKTIAERTPMILDYQAIMIEE